MSTRRCTQRQFWLRPSKKTNRILLYCLAVAAERTGLQLHSFCCISNHEHNVATDPLGKRPEFHHLFHTFSAKCLNAYYGRWENLWSSEQTSVVNLVDAQAQIGKTLYTQSNPVSSHLVPHSTLWPGVISRPEDIGKTIKIKRPKGFFAKDSKMPKVAKLKLTKLPALAHLSDADYAKHLRQLIEAHEQELRQQMKAEGRLFFLGRKAILEQNPWDSPTTFAPHRQLSPRLACKNKWARIEAIQRIKEFVDGYALALTAFVVGDRNVVFPAGTYWMVRYVGARCAPAG